MMSSSYLLHAARAWHMRKFLLEVAARRSGDQQERFALSERFLLPRCRRRQLDSPRQDDMPMAKVSQALFV